MSKAFDTVNQVIPLRHIAESKVQDHTSRDGQPNKSMDFKLKLTSMEQSHHTKTKVQAKKQGAELSSLQQIPTNI